MPELTSFSETFCPRWAVDGKRTYVRKCSWGETWRVLEPLGLRISSQRGGLACEPIELVFEDGHVETWWTHGTLGDLP